MKEIQDIVKGFDERIELSSNHLYDKFGLENAEELLKPFFKHIEKRI